MLCGKHCLAAIYFVSLQPIVLPDKKYVSYFKLQKVAFYLYPSNLLLMKYCLFFITLLLSTSIFAQQDGYTKSKEAIKGMMKPVETTSSGKLSARDTLKLPNNAFQKGEELKYEMHYGFVTGAVMRSVLTDTVINGKRVLHSHCMAKTVGIADALFEVKDVYQSYFDPETNLPVKAIRNISESTYRFYNEVDFFHDEDMVYSRRSKKKVKVPDGIMDLIAAFYYSRRVQFDKVKTVGQVVTFQTWFDDRVFELKVKYRGIEKIKTDVGRIRCMKFNPIVEKGRVFDTENDISFWVSTDKNHIPIRAQMKLMIGSFKCDLVEHKNLLHPLAKVKR